MKASNLHNLFNESFETFILEERNEILNWINERSLCTSLWIYIHDNLRKFWIEWYHIDTDYNRKQNGQVKTIIGEEMEVIKIYADLILHSRWRSHNQDNLIAIEMKKSYRTDKEKNDDRNRLIAMTKDSYNNDVWSYDWITHPEHVCRYILWVYIEIDNQNMEYLLEFYEKWKQIGIKNWKF